MFLLCYSAASPVGRRAMSIAFALIALCQLCGCFTMLNYTAAIFAESGSDMSANSAAIIIGFIQLIGAYISTVLVDRAGRKVILIKLKGISTSISNFVLFFLVLISSFSNGISYGTCELRSIHSISGYAV